MPDGAKREDWRNIAYPDEPESTERERRIGRDERKERVRTALRGASEQYGYYVFDELHTEDAGTLAFLAIGTPGAVAIVVRDDAGEVYASVDGELLLGNRLFQDDPHQQMAELSDDVRSRVPKAVGYVRTLICFSQAEVVYPDDLELMRGVCTIWTLAWNLDPEDDELDHLASSDIVELADEVQRVYGRPPIIAPELD